MHVLTFCLENINVDLTFTIYYKLDYKSLKCYTFHFCPDYKTILLVIYSQLMNFTKVFITSLFHCDNIHNSGNTNHINGKPSSETQSTGDDQNF